MFCSDFGVQILSYNLSRYLRTYVDECAQTPKLYHSSVNIK